MKLVKPVIYPSCGKEESPAGYLMRLVGINGYEKYAWLFQQDVNESYKLPSMEKLYEMLCDQPWTEVKDRHQYSELAEFSYRYVRSPAVRVCPECIKKYGRWHLSWHTTFKAICTEHKRWLMEQCPACQQRYSWRSGTIEHCQCGHRREQADNNSIPDDQFALARFLDGCDSPLGTYNLDPTEFGFKERCDLIILFSKFSNKHTRRAPGQFSRYKTIAELQTVYQRVGPILFGRQQFLENLLDEMIAQNDERFNRFYNKVFSYPQASLGLIKSEISLRIRDCINQPLNRRHKNIALHVIEDHPWMSLQTAAKRFGISKLLMTRLIGIDGLTTKTNSYNNYKKTMVHIADKGKYQERVNDIIDFKRAIKLIGVTKKQFYQLIKVCEVDGTYSPNETCTHWLFSRSGIDTFLRSFNVYMRERTTSRLFDKTEFDITFRDCLIYFSSGTTGLFDQTISAVINKELPLSGYSLGEGISGLLFCRAEFIEWRNAKFDITKEDSIDSVAAALEVSHEFIAQLVNQGFIEYTYDKNRPRKKKISIDSLNKFKSSYALLSKMAKASRMSSAAMERNLAYEKIYPLNNNLEFSFKQKFYDRKDIINSLRLGYMIEKLGDWSI